MKTIIWKGNVEKYYPSGMYTVAYEYEDAQGKAFSSYVYDTYEDARDFANAPLHKHTYCDDSGMCATCNE